MEIVRETAISCFTALSLSLRVAWCIRSWRNCKICTELSEILVVTYYPEKLARRKSLLVFCVLCNCEQTVLLKKKKVFTFPLLKKKNQIPALFVITALVGVLFHCFWTASLHMLLPNNFPSVGSQM